jgi:hypothetical protein
MKHKVKWQVSLNNGETFYEDKGRFIEIEGELSPWNKLQEYIKDNNLEITSLALYTDLGQRFNLPSNSSNPKFKAFISDYKPYKYSLERKLGFDINGTANELYTTICSIYKIENIEIKLSVWVDENNTMNSWSNIEVK